jgi:Protein of unknown function (DUF2933)
MKTDRLPAFVLGATAVVGSLLIAGVPPASLLPLAPLLVCPLMMLFMMRGMGTAASAQRMSHAETGPSHLTDVAGDRPDARRATP